jgi:sarcosine oxidase delta subunit
VSFVLSCPHCGLRDVNEFRFQGEVTRRPGKTPKLIAPFALARFHTDTLVSELAAAAVSH